VCAISSVASPRGSGSVSLGLAEVGRFLERSCMVFFSSPPRPVPPVPYRWRPPQRFSRRLSFSRRFAFPPGF